MFDTTDPTFYRTPGEAIAAPPEQLAYVAAYDPAGRAKDAMAVIDTDPASATHGRVVGWSELPTAGNELHHFGWNACSSALCHRATATTASPWSAATCWCPASAPPHLCPRHQARPPQPPGRARDHRRGAGRQGRLLPPHTLHCGPGGIFMSAIGGANGNDGPGGVALLDHDTFDVVGAWEHDRGDQYFAYDVWWHLNYDTVITSEWATPR